MKDQCGGGGVGGPDGGSDELDRVRRGGREPGLLPEPHTGRHLQDPGAIFREIRSDARPDKNPKDVVDTYPQYFANVGDLFQQRCAG